MTTLSKTNKQFIDQIMFDAPSEYTYENAYHELEEVPEQWVNAIGLEKSIDEMTEREASRVISQIRDYIKQEYDISGYEEYKED